MIENSGRYHWSNWSEYVHALLTSKNGEVVILDEESRKNAELKLMAALVDAVNQNTEAIRRLPHR